MLKLFSALLLLPFCLTFSFALLPYGKLLKEGSAHTRTFLIGMGLYALWFVVSILWKKDRFSLILEHELTHLLWSKLLGGKIHSLKINPSRGGEIQHSRNHFIVNLAPYFFPTYTFLLFLIYPFLQNKFVPFFMVVIGISFGYHLISTALEVRLRQPDIRETGIFFSSIFILFMNILILGIVLSTVTCGLPEVLNFFWRGLRGVKIILVYIFT